MPHLEHVPRSFWQENITEIYGSKRLCRLVCSLGRQFVSSDSNLKISGDMAASCLKYVERNDTPV